MASPKKISIVCLPGDGVGPEVVAEAVKVLQKVAAHRSKSLNVEFEFKNELIGLAALEKTGMYTLALELQWALCNEDRVCVCGYYENAYRGRMICVGEMADIWIAYY